MFFLVSKYKIENGRRAYRGIGVLRAKSETIDRGCPGQENKMSEGVIHLIFIARTLFFSELRGCPGAGWHIPWCLHWVCLNNVKLW
jgi:hypothetical protein